MQEEFTVHQHLVVRDGDGDMGTGMEMGMEMGQELNLLFRASHHHSVRQHIQVNLSVFGIRKLYDNH